MATLNITYNGLSADYPMELDALVSDADVKRIAVEVLRSGHVAGLALPHLADSASCPASSVTPSGATS